MSRLPTPSLPNSGPRSPHDTEIDAALRTHARSLAAQLIKRRARAYFRRPTALETLTPGLSCAAPDQMIAIATHLLTQERAVQKRWFAFGGEAPALNARAALLLGRVFRRAARRLSPAQPNLNRTPKPPRG
jgi:hypothetical protein